MKQLSVLIILVLVSISACTDNDNTKKRNLLMMVIGATSDLSGNTGSVTLMTGVNTAQPSSTVKMVFIHHSTGSAWIATGNGHQKATAEFVPLLNVYYNNWKGL